MKLLQTIVVVLLIFSLSTPAQEVVGQQEPGVTIQTTVEEVLLDVIVRDNKGQFLKDLKPGEIEIYEDGKKQEVRSFRFISGTEAFSPGEAAAESKTLDPLRQVRLVSLAYERLDQNGRRLARKASLELLKDDQSTNVYYSVMRLDPSLKILQPFTTDRKLLQKAVELATGGEESLKSDVNLDALRQEAESMAAQGTDPSSPEGPGAAAEGANIVAAEMARVVMQMVALSSNLEGQQMGSNSISALTALVKGQQSLPGRKTVLYFSSGLSLNDNVIHRFDSLVGSANSANVAFYAIDARGLSSYSTASASGRELARAATVAQSTATRRDGRVTAAEMKQTDTALNSMYADTQQNLNSLAERTGGFLIANSNNLRKPMAKVVEDVYAYYEIAYSPTNKDYDGNFRALEVKLNRKKADIQSRSGYFAMPPELKEAMFPYEVPLLRAIADTSSPMDVEFRANWYNFMPAAGMRRCAFDLEVPFEKIGVWKDEITGLYKTSVSVVAMFKDQDGRVVRKFSRMVPLQIPEEKLAALKKGTFSYNDHFAVPPGTYRMEVAVADPQDGKIGVKKTDVLIEEHEGGVALSDLTLIKRIDEAPADNPDTYNPFLFPGGKVVPTLAPIDSADPGAQVSIYFLVYPDKKAGAAPTATIEFYSGAQRLGQLQAELPGPDERGRISYIASVQASALPPGTYEARVTASQGEDSDSATMSFTIQ